MITLLLRYLWVIPYTYIVVVVVGWEGLGQTNPIHLVRLQGGAAGVDWVFHCCMGGT